MIISNDIPSELLAKSGQIGHSMKLVKPYLGKGHRLVTDNSYSSPNLFLELRRNLTNACGTVRNTAGYTRFD